MWSRVEGIEHMRKVEPVAKREYYIFTNWPWCKWGMIKHFQGGMRYMMKKYLDEIHPNCPLS